MKWLAAALALKAVTHVPVMLPQHIPQNPPYAVVEENRPRYYSVDFAWAPNCNGAHVCSEAHAIGSAEPIAAGYTAPAVAAYCNDASLAWRSGKFYYELTLKCGTHAELEAMRASMRRYFP